MFSLKTAKPPIDMDKPESYVCTSFLVGPQNRHVYAHERHNRYFWEVWCVFPGGSGPLILIAAMSPSRGSKVTLTDAAMRVGSPVVSLLWKTHMIGSNNVNGFYRYIHLCLNRPKHNL